MQVDLCHWPARAGNPSGQGATLGARPGGSRAPVTVSVKPIELFRKSSFGPGRCLIPPPESCADRRGGRKDGNLPSGIPLVSGC